MFAPCIVAGLPNVNLTIPSFDSPCAPKISFRGAAVIEFFSGNRVAPKESFEHLPDTLQLIASALTRAGFSLAQAIDAVVREDLQPIAGEVSRALAEVRLGGNLEDGLDAIADRMDSDDLHWTVTAIRIQQGVGGNLAEILLTIAGTIRERAFLRRHVRALSARLSAYVLVALPVLIGIWLFASATQYMRPLYTTPVGELALGAAIVMVVLGTIWMRKMINIKI